jgi:hypothetical protein
VTTKIFYQALLKASCVMKFIRTLRVPHRHLLFFISMLPAYLNQRANQSGTKRIKTVRSNAQCAGIRVLQNEYAICGPQ